MYVLSIDIPFKDSQSHSKMRCKVTLVSFLRSGVNDSVVHVTVVSIMTPLCNQSCRFTPKIRSHIQKGFNPCIRGLGELFDKKNRGRKSRVRVPLNIFDENFKSHLKHCS
jgi:hypothetical protein